MLPPTDNMDSMDDSGMDMPIMIEDNAQDNLDGKTILASKVYKSMANAFTMYFQTHGAHWNVRGTDFAQYHEFFSEIYEEVFDSVDTLSEILRKLGFDSPMNLSDIADATDLPDIEESAFDTQSLTAAVYAANKLVIASLEDAFDAGNDIDQQGVCNFLAERIDMHQKWQWQLRSSLGLDGNAPDEK